MSNPARRRICFVSPFAYPLLVPGSSGAGGAERQFFLFARGLQQRGWEVSFITGLPSKELSSAEPLFPVYPVNLSYLGGHKTQLPAAWLALWRAMQRADANYYVLKVPAHLLSLMAVFCKTYKRRLASWGQTTYRKEKHRRHIPRSAQCLESFGLRAADILIAQTEDQASGLRDVTGRRVHVIPNIAESVEASGEARSSNDGTNVLCDVLWVGNTTVNKRPGVVMEMARLLPQVSFAMAMNKSSPEEFAKWEEAAATITNLRFLGQLPPGQTEGWFSRTCLFLNTSDREGFPNTFLQAWMNGVPVVSLGIDPDCIIKTHELGRLPDPLDVELAGEDALKLALCLAPVVRSLLSDVPLRRHIGANARQYVLSRHAPDNTVPALESVLLSCP